MLVTGISSYNQKTSSYNINNSKQKSNGSNPQFKGAYNNLSEWIANNYYVKFYKSSFGKKFLKLTEKDNWFNNNITTHMSVLGSTLISGLYVMRTLQNDKLDEKKRKTLAINDVFTWALSTAVTYILDNKLHNWWDGVTTRFAANYIDTHHDAKNTELLGDWDPANLKDMMKNWHKVANERIEKHNARVSAPDYKGTEKIMEKVEEKVFKNVRDFNLDVLKNPKLTTMIDGMGVLKSLFIFCMIYRYVVPVLVMKPANYIGRKLHEKNEQQNIQQNEQQKTKVVA